MESFLKHGVERVLFRGFLHGNEFVGVLGLLQRPRSRRNTNVRARVRGRGKEEEGKRGGGLENGALHARGTKYDDGAELEGMVESAGN
jgi:hypothetical protein